MPVLKPTPVLRPMVVRRLRVPGLRRTVRPLLTARTRTLPRVRRVTTQTHPITPTQKQRKLTPTLRVTTQTHLTTLTARMQMLRPLPMAMTQTLRLPQTARMTKPIPTQTVMRSLKPRRSETRPSLKVERSPARLLRTLK
ncbi:hypothetical protein [Brevibacterium pigmentatum]|uniref:hypothetical protein n=1 Tax=Brevibacterium pigmentatum TaxID=1496080 RepID=UPI0014227BD6|nr:hypothetical protein [Brevibacterium pigmentatum]